MSQPIRRFLAAMSMAAALLLAVPAPSRAAQVRKPAPDLSLGLMTQAWSWLESLLGGLGKPGAVERKDTTATAPPPAPPPSPPQEGPMIDPDGVKR